MLHQIMRHGDKHFQGFPGHAKTSMQHRCDMDCTRGHYSDGACAARQNHVIETRPVENGGTAAWRTLPANFPEIVG
jgi:hypothetical protein